MARYTITPWRHQSDLLAVRHSLYSSNRESQRHAVNRVMAWKLRSNLPHAVESTALLVDAILHHDLTHNSIFSIRAVYSAAFTRFVTGFCDIGRNRERALEPSSMLEIAKQIGMPVEFVALRHEATHEELPSVQRLVAVCGQALDWLWRVYWTRLEVPATVAAEMGEVEVQQVKDEARRIFKEFRSARRQALKAKYAASQNYELVQKTANAVSALCANLPHAHAAASEVLINDKMLFPIDRELGAPLHGAYLLWEDLLLAVSSRQTAFLFTLTDQMLDALTQPTNSRLEYESGREALFQWLFHIATSASWQRTCQDAASDTTARMMGHCCLYPGFWSGRLGAALLKASDNQDFTEAWADLLAASLLNMQEPAMDEDEVISKDPDQEVLKTSDAGGEAMSVDDSAVGRWRETFFAPTAPIGAVR